MQILTFENSTVPETKFVVHSRAENSLIIKELTGCDPVGVAIFLVVEVSKALTSFQAVHAEAMIGAGGYALILAHVNTQNSTIVLWSKR